MNLIINITRSEGSGISYDSVLKKQKGGIFMLRKGNEKNSSVSYYKRLFLAQKEARTNGAFTGTVYAGGSKNNVAKKNDYVVVIR